MIPKGSTKTDWEVELGVVIGSTARYVESGNALEYVAGYVVINGFGASIPDRAGRYLGQRQGMRHVRAGGSVAGHRR